MNSYYCTKCRHEINNTKVPVNKTCIHCGGEMHIKQEKEMQKFENNAPVTIIYAENGDKRNAEWIGMNRLLHVVKLETGGFCEFGNDYIMPRQLICNEARGKIETMRKIGREFFVRFNSINQFKEFHSKSDNKFDEWWPQKVMSFGLICRPDIEDDIHGQSKKEHLGMPELNLKTGEIVPCEEPEIELSRSEKARIEVNSTINVQNSEIAALVLVNDKLHLQLKEADVRNENKKAKMKDMFSRSVEQLKTIDEYKRHHDSHMRKMSNLEEHLDSALEELKESNSNLALLGKSNSDLNTTVEVFREQINKQINQLKEKDEAMELAHIAMKEAESCITEFKEGNKDLCEKLHAKDDTVKKFAAMIDELELAVTEKDVTIANLKELDSFKVAELMKSERDAISIELLEAHETINGFFEHWVSIQKQTESYLYDVKKTTKGE